MTNDITTMSSHYAHEHMQHENEVYSISVIRTTVTIHTRQNLHVVQFSLTRHALHVPQPDKRSVVIAFSTCFRLLFAFLLYSTFSRAYTYGVHHVTMTNLQQLNSSVFLTAPQIHTDTAAELKFTNCSVLCLQPEKCMCQ